MGTDGAEDSAPSCFAACCTALRARPGRLLFLFVLLDVAGHSLCLSRLSANTFLRELGLVNKL